MYDKFKTHFEQTDNGKRGGNPALDPPDWIKTREENNAYLTYSARRIFDNLDHDAAVARSKEILSRGGGCR